jgi:DNA-binding IclR family transcriptional regulator
VSAPGKALLAHRPAWCDSLFARPLRRDTDGTLIDPRDLKAEPKSIRHRGYATDRGAHKAPAHTIAAPVLQTNDAVAAITLTAATAAHINDLDALAARINSFATTLATALHSTES